LTNNETLTRTIKVSCLSRFLLSCLPAGRCSCTQDKFVMRAKPGLEHLPTIKFLHLDKFLSPRQLVPRHCTSAHLPTFCCQDNLLATYQLCTATLILLNKICTRTAKTRAIPSLHRDNFLAKVPGPCPVLASGNTTSLYCRAVVCYVKLTICNKNFKNYYELLI
jgi:hypothetical protein